MNKYLLSLSMGTLVFFLDRITKAWALQACFVPYVVNSWCSGILTYNTGIAWSIGTSCAPWIVTGWVVGTLIALCILTTMSWVKHSSLAALCGSTLVASGALSNVLDRFLYSGVVDFIVLHYHGWQWPTFNVADAAICCGALLWYWGSDV